MRWYLRGRNTRKRRILQKTYIFRWHLVAKQERIDKIHSKQFQHFFEIYKEYGVFLSCKADSRRSVHSPQDHVIITLIISNRRDWRDTRGKWPLARNISGYVYIYHDTELVPTTYRPKIVPQTVDRISTASYSKMSKHRTLNLVITIIGCIWAYSIQILYHIKHRFHTEL